ncbi:MAG: winged helix-turn-helix domain-containing protein [Dinoroseobacter sp.]|nr:winged helix-turn-helix domain-containing protein [Dinoroseobacter sp.]
MRWTTGSDALPIWEGKRTINMDNASLSAIRFGAATYDFSTGCLMSDSGVEFVLRWQSMQVLRLLAENLGSVVLRDDLIAQIWGDVSVTDDSLTQCIADIRRALGDADRTLLKTFPKRGYQLNGTPVELRATIPAKPAAIGDALQIAPSHEPAIVPNSIVADLDPRDVFPTLAVLPMRAIGEDTACPLGMFVSDEIIGALGRSQELNVISRLSTAQFWQQYQEGHELRAALNADFVVSGWMRTSGQEVTLSFEFSETERQIVLWSDRIRLPIAALMANTDWVEGIVSSIRKAIVVCEVDRVCSKPLESLKLYSLLHGAVGLMHRLSPLDFSKAHSILTQLIEQVPHNPMPFAWMARWHVLRAVQGWSADVQKDARMGMENAVRALEIDPENTLALTSLGFVMTNLLHRLDEARKHYDTALEINPNAAQARALRGMLQAFVDETKEGKRDTERALHLTPRDPHRFFYLVLAAGANLSAGEYDRAVLLAKESLRLNRTHVSTLRTLAAAQVGAGQGDQARETAGKLMVLQPELKISAWLQSAPSRNFENGKRFASLLKDAGVPD